jgi:lysophospholipase L1-like esterase
MNTGEDRPGPITLRGIMTLAATYALITAVSLILGLVVVEAYLRFTIPKSSGGSIFEYTLATKRYKVLKRDFRSVVWGKEFRTNELGFRDRQREVPPKADGEYRVVVLGDSFTASAGVDFDDIFTSVVEKDIRVDHPNFRVINLAVGGYNPIQYALVLDEVGLSLRPDLVLIAAFPFNDLSSADYRQNQDAASGKRAAPTASPWYDQLYLYRVFYPRIASRLEQWSAKEASPAMAAAARVAAIAAAKVASRDSAENLHALAGIVDTVRAHGIEALIVLLPHTGAFDRQRVFFAPFVSFCQEAHLPCMNLLNGFVEAHVNSRTLPLNRIDDHPNAVYHKAVAALLEPALREAIQRSEARSTQGQRPQLSPSTNAKHPH